MSCLTCHVSRRHVTKCREEMSPKYVFQRSSETCHFETCRDISSKTCRDITLCLPNVVTCLVLTVITPYYICMLLLFRLLTFYLCRIICIEQKVKESSCCATCHMALTERLTVKIGNVTCINRRPQHQIGAVTCNGILHFILLPIIFLF
jgi:hypothetical protein